LNWSLMKIRQEIQLLCINIELFSCVRRQEELFRVLIF